MSEFVIGTPLETTDATIEVTVNVQKPIPVGKHRFQLLVVDDSGNKSLPSVVDVVVKDSQNPTAIVTAPSQVEYGKSFVLDGRTCSDVPPGKVVKYVWVMLE